MRHILIALGFAACAALGSTTVHAQTFEPRGPVFEPGGPVRIGNMCQVDTDDQGDDAFGYVAPCPNQALAAVPEPQLQPQAHRVRAPRRHR
ncbi:MAG TPA: hypothetical protein VFT69_19535 [Pseudolabrys sp.]|nr:hypothetical protein [Pseudolabrys sp.]